MKILLLAVFGYILSISIYSEGIAETVEKNRNTASEWAKVFYVKYNKDIRISAILDVCDEHKLVEKFRVDWHQEIKRIKDSKLHESERYLELVGRKKMDEREIMGPASAAVNFMVYFENGFKEGIAFYKKVNPSDFKQSCDETIKFVKENPKQDLIIVK